MIAKVADASTQESSANAEFDAYWMPFTPNRYFKSHPKLIASARGAYYTTLDGRRLFDALSGMWCCPIGHAHPRITQALTHQAETLDYSPAFQIGSPITFSFANRIAQLAPADLSRVFFANSGSEAVDSAIKIAIAYHRARGDATRTRLIGRERAYHGVGLAGLSLGGIGPQPQGLPVADHRLHRPSAAHLRSQPDGVHQGRARLGDAPRRRARTIGHAARRVEHRRARRRTDAGIDRRHRPAGRLSQATARDLHQARHPADFRRSDHRFRPPRYGLRGTTLRRRSRHDRLRQGGSPTASSRSAA